MTVYCRGPSHTHTTEPYPSSNTNCTTQGPSFTVRGNHISWQNWNLRLGFTSQEGLVLQMVGFNDRLKAPDGACGDVFVCRWVHPHEMMDTTKT